MKNKDNINIEANEFKIKNLLEKSKKIIDEAGSELAIDPRREYFYSEEIQKTIDGIKEKVKQLEQMLEKRLALERKEILEELRKVFKQKFPHISEINPGTSMQELHMNILDKADIADYVGKKFGINLGDIEKAELNTVDDWINYIQFKMK